MNRAPGLSVRLKLTLSYAGFLILTGALLLTAVWVFLLRGGPPVGSFIPSLRDLRIIFTPGNFGPAVFGPAAGAAMLFLLAFGLLGGWILAGHMLAPLTRITHATRMATNGSLSHRIRLPGRDDEFRQLADAFDTMLARLEAQLAEQQRFAANASHELRTPLAISKTLLEVARTDPTYERTQLIERLQAVNTRAIDLTEALLLLSRAGQRSFTRETVDLSLLVEEATETLLPLAEKRGVAIDAGGDVSAVSGSPALLLQLIMNLVQNAIVHNLPGLGHVWVTTGVRSRTVLLTIENTGAAISPRQAATLTEPFQRGSDRLHTDDAGVGLGLAIVKTITQAHGGTLTLAPRSGGGMCVSVELPGTAPASPPGGAGSLPPGRRMDEFHARSTAPVSKAALENDVWRLM